MWALALTLVALAALAAAAVAAERVARRATPPAPGLSIADGRPLFALHDLRHGDTAERCVTLTNESAGDVRAAVRGRGEDGDLAPHLAVAVSRGCSEGTLLFSGRMNELAAAQDPSPWPAGARRQYRIAVEVAGSYDQVQGRRAVQEFAFAADGEDPAPAE